MTSEEAAPQSAICPSCERFIGPATTCPYCDADSRHAPFLRRLRYAALLLAILGLAALYLMARQQAVPAVEIRAITPMMNFAFVRITGTVVREPYVSHEGDRVDYASFLISDETGDLRVAAYREVARALVDGGRLPAKGDRVDVSGVLNVSGDGQVRLRLQTARHLQACERAMAKEPPAP